MILQAMMQLPHSELIIVGEGEERLTLQTFIDQNSLSERVTLLGKRIMLLIITMIPMPLCWPLTMKVLLLSLPKLWHVDYQWSQQIVVGQQKLLKWTGFWHNNIG